MTIAIDQPIEQKQLSFDEFLARYGGDNRYELIDGEVFDLEPTGLHEEVAAFITTKVCVQIDKIDLPWFVLQRGLLRPSHLNMTAFRPDVAVVDRDELSKELLWSNQSILTLGSSIKFVAEVVSSNWQNDYARKVEDYAVLGIPEYWIADYAGLGGTRHIGKPKQPTLSICTLVDGEYEIQQFRGNQTITSTIFPGLKLTAEQVLRAGG
ncbi:MULTISPECIES: Uma2 family endonuclease [unclassified Microcystis]|jgi:Uma2 family endonuclease|uniref:Uma2 family endonuclease n=1 Tax=Microcystis flos-aquae Mf_QC_C_20070823_S10D TaxID=2486236 RepID=A0A552KVF3_9CHRO|nr:MULTISPECIES: Uma2 family endonuclease [unclassified Microcystis]MCA2819212.1 Uma2 family endonuclease [Microcystis sp. M085S1]MCA2855794.1 Uma2 family endonuclease [Microcystis sp. M065S1]TRT74636.1 MAG: Uma2 family endonuclease [Microcystis flos-aquae Ma_QC_C_20070823_S18]TRU03281.1 MAG: Uma2 family endonuclease [Microcystis flos-aquae Ma_QC_C_20070823_S18D]TRV11959.1 MAG: Uma2 family endonuclease [Microcystis flos-aquae Mf_QC_C_20070823_S10D]TRV20815.1 MAG: Uma2 family endonuclease [Mic